MGLIPSNFTRVAQVGRGQNGEREVEERKREDAAEGEEEKKEREDMERDTRLVNTTGEGADRQGDINSTNTG